MTASLTQAAIKPQTCPMMAAAGLGTDYLYAFGIVRPIFPSKDVEERFKAVAKQRKVQYNDFYDILTWKQSPSDTQPDYDLASSLCWLLEIDDEPLYYLKPRSWVEMQALIETQKDKDKSQLYSLVIGTRGPLSPPQLCHGLELPMVWITKLYYGHLKELISYLVSQMEKILKSQDLLSDNDALMTVVSDLINDLSFPPNRGESDRDRALNYLVFANVDMYIKYYDMVGIKSTHGQPSASSSLMDSFYLLRVKTESSSDKRVVDVIFVYQKRITDEQQAFYCSVDVTGQFPFVKTPLRPYTIS